jgi:CPA1 family monovalent cation:H+ antiporter
MFTFRRERFGSRFDREADGTIEDRSASYRRLLRELLAAQRDAVLALPRNGHIDDEVLRRVVSDLDLEEARLR